ncbi:hypothetical protein [Magnetospirillum aberrantis]|uniref:Uncharacterized protein n=1 Tax=Magnetospirillum aberrantis SpK TaxID=908842 RepID=A0A7C9QW55_9PROT|nr:hypothetical protein [Magnetospirillum aberrantis]NFV81897.1 hypothetical protein [Magnetospirillum aberrantis SpK]
MYFTEEILQQVILWAIQRTSLSLGLISEGDQFIPEDAFERIALAKGHRDALMEFVAAYGAWYAFHLEIYKAEKQGKLNPEENNRLMALIHRRDNAKKTLLDITD